MKSRKAISKSRRFEVFKRDGFVCQYCGAHPPAAVLHVDHIVPVAEGGGNEESNLVTACSACNLGKGARTLDSAPQSLAERAAEVAEREAQIRGYAEVMDARKERIQQDVWRVAEPFCDLHYSGEMRLDRDWFTSIERFNEKLGVHRVEEAMGIALGRKPHSANQCFRYFCGVCWNWVREGEAA